MEGQEENSLPRTSWSFTRYSVSKDRFFISKGFFSVKDDEVDMYSDYGYFIGALIHAETCRSRNY